jgi:hypothetical protein
MKVLEVPKSRWVQGFWSDGPGEASNTIYWWETLFSGGTAKSYEIVSPLAAISKGEGSSTTPRRSKEEWGQGGGAPLGPPPAGAPCAAGGGALPFTAAFFGWAAASSPWGGTSPSSSTTPPHHPYSNLLANMICGTIYYFPMIYCVYVYVWVVIVHDNCEILFWLVSYKFVNVYNGLMYWYMSARIYLGDA